MNKYQFVSKFTIGQYVICKGKVYDVMGYDFKQFYCGTEIRVIIHSCIKGKPIVKYVKEDSLKETGEERRD